LNGSLLVGMLDEYHAWYLGSNLEVSATLASVLVKDLPARVGLTGSELGSIHAEGDPVEGFVAKLIEGMHEAEPGHFRAVG